GRLKPQLLTIERNTHAQADVQAHPLDGFIALQILHAGGEQELWIFLEGMSAMPVHEASVDGVSAHVDADRDISALIRHQSAQQQAWPDEQLCQAGMMNLVHGALQSHLTVTTWSQIETASEYRRQPIPVCAQCRLQDRFCGWKCHPGWCSGVRCHSHRGGLNT